MKTKNYRFVIEVKSAQSQRAALSRILYLFASRQPDGIELHTKVYRSPAHARNQPKEKL